MITMRTSRLTDVSRLTGPRRVVVVLAAVAVAAMFGRLIDFPAVSSGFIADEATYVSMTFSLANDFDLKYEQRDLRRFGALYGAGSDGRPVGPEGIFLKKTTRSTATALDYAKSYAYPIAAAPFARLGGLGGMFMFNVVLLVGCAWCAAVFAAARMGSTWGWAVGVLFIAASSVPEWATYLMPEVFNFALVLFAYFLWLYKEVRPVERSGHGDFLGSVWSDVAAAVLIGVAAYSKLSNAALIAPLVAYAVWTRASRRAILPVAAFGLSVVVLFGLQVAVSGEFNYQSGVRKTFYGNFPFDAAGTTFDGAANASVTATGGDTPISSDILFPGHPRFWSLLGHNAGYFIWGRDSGLLPYYFPGAFLLALWLLRIRESTRWQWCVLAAAAGVAGFFIFWTPYTWNGAGGPIGNRYYVSVYPLFLFLLPATAGAWTAIACGIGGMAFLWPVFAHPFLVKNRPWLPAENVPLRWLPVERTMLNDIPSRLESRRYKIPFGSPRNAYLYLMDGNTYNGEPLPAGYGFWIAGGRTAEIIVATGFPRAHVRLTVSSPIANTFRANWGGAKCAVVLAPNEPQICDLYTDDAVWAHDSYFYSLTMSTTAGFVPAQTIPLSADDRNLGVSVVPVFSEQ